MSFLNSKNDSSYKLINIMLGIFNSEKLFLLPTFNLFFLGIQTVMFVMDMVKNDERDLGFVFTLIYKVSFIDVY